MTCKAAQLRQTSDNEQGMYLAETEPIERKFNRVVIENNGFWGNCNTTVASDMYVTNNNSLV